MLRQSLNRNRDGKLNIRLLVLLGLLLLVGAAFLYDKYSLVPSNNEKITKVMQEVTLSLNDGNRKAVEEIVGINPSNIYQHGSLEVVQYRFPRGLPFYPGQVLDVAYNGDAIAIVKNTELTPELLDQLKPASTLGKLDRDNRDETILSGVGGGGGGRDRSSDNNEEDAESSDENSDEGTDSDEASSETDDS